MKQCSRCRKRKRQTEFTRNASRKDGLNSSCKACHRRYTHQHYVRNKAYYVAKSHQHNAKIEILIDAAKRRPCADCKRQFHTWQMDFDHVRGQKEFELGVARKSGYALARVQAELAKCDVVCSNCHRQRTHERQHADSCPCSSMDRALVYGTSNGGSTPSKDAMHPLSSLRYQYPF